jgi:hypothetical protein
MHSQADIASPSHLKQRKYAYQITTVQEELQCQLHVHLAKKVMLACPAQEHAIFHV